MNNITFSRRMLDTGNGDRAWSQEEELFLIRCVDYEMKSTFREYERGPSKRSWNSIERKMMKKFPDSGITLLFCRIHMDSLDEEYISSKLVNVPKRKPRAETAIGSCAV